MRRALGLAAVLMASCDRRVESTFVVGTVAGVRFSSPSAIGEPKADTSTFSLDNDGVLITDVPSPCSNLVNTGVLQANGVTDPTTRRRAPALILHGGNAQLDPGGTAERVPATSARLNVTEREENGTLRGHFTATFDGGTFSGDFVAPRCARLSTGCSAGGGLEPLLLLTAGLLWRRRRRHANTRG